MSVNTPLPHAAAHSPPLDPGPRCAAVSGLVYWYVLVRGDLAHWYHRMHEQYGEVVRVGPNKLSFINPQAWKDIYGHKVGAAAKKAIMKDPASYRADDNGERNIAVILDDREHSAVRKVFTNAFSDKALKQQESLIQGYVDKLVKNLYATAGQETDMIKNYNCTTFDIMGDLAFGEPLGLLDNSEYSPWVSPALLLPDVILLTRAIGQSHLQRYQGRRPHGLRPGVLGRWRPDRPPPPPLPPREEGSALPVLC